MSDNQKQTQTDFNTLSNLFKEYQNSSTKNYSRLSSVSYSNEDVNNFREDFYDFDIKEEEEFSKYIMKKLDLMKKKSIEYFENNIKKIEEIFEKFKIRISSFINNKERKISDVKNLLNNRQSILKYASENIFKKLNNIIKICDNIINNIEKNFELLNIFFDQKHILDSRKQIENFLINNSKLIENCSVINKFNFTEIDTTNLNKIDYYNHYLKYLSQKKIEDEESVKNFVIKAKEDYNSSLLFLVENYVSLEKLKIEGIGTSEFQSILQNMKASTTKKKKEDNLKNLSIKNFGSIEYKNNMKKLNKLKKLKIQNGIYINTSIISNLFIENNKNLISLSLDNINMTDIGFKSILLSLIKNKNITETLEYLSFEGNRITTVKYDKDNNQIQDQFFNNLKTLNLSKNMIYKFEFWLSALINLRFLDLTGNNIPTSTFMNQVIENKKEKEKKRKKEKEKDKTGNNFDENKYKDILVLLNDNMFITNSQKNNNEYINYLNDILPNFDSDIKNLNLNFTYDIETQIYLEKLKFSLNLTISLIKLDLSFCGLDTDTLIKFFKNNSKFFSLRNLNLRYNNIKSDFFEKINSNNEICLDNINYIDLSENEIICETVEKIENLCLFIENHQNLEKLKIINTGFFSDWIDNVKDSNPNADKFKGAFVKLKKNLDENKREFKFILNEGNINFVKKEFQDLFNFIC